MFLKVHPYQLPIPNHFPRNHEGRGALLSIEDDENNVGYADLHPWPSLGDLSINEQLQKLKAGTPTLQTQLSLEYAKRDLNARKTQSDGVSFLKEIKNHHLVLNDISSLNDFEDHFTKRTSLNFFGKFQKENTYETNVLIETPAITLKLKLSPELSTATFNLINSAVDKYPSLRWRLDANSLFDFQQMIQFWNHLTLSAKNQIEFVEDPCPYDQLLWVKLEEEGIPLAIDFEVTNWKQIRNFDSPTPSGNTIFVIKPAIQDISEWTTFLTQNPHRFFVTNYLDHPVGLLHSLWSTEQLYKKFPNLLLTCGLSLPFEPELLEIFWSTSSLNLNPSYTWIGPKDYGIGNSKILKELSWIPLGKI